MTASDHAAAARARSPARRRFEIRAPFEIGASFAARPLLARRRCGAGHAVMVRPGLAAGDLATLPLRSFLRARGAAAHGWGGGLNRGREQNSEFMHGDGVVARRCAVQHGGERTESIEVRGSHVALVGNPPALHAIAERLAQPEGQWRPFERRRMRRRFYPDPTR